jgi:hypothetical protein
VTVDLPRRSKRHKNDFPRLLTLVTARTSARVFRSDVVVDWVLSAAASGGIEDENDTYASGVELVLERVAGVFLNTILSS